MGEIMVSAAGAAADLAQQPGSREEAVALLERLTDLQDPEYPCFPMTSPSDVVHAARLLLFEAETARCRGDAAGPDRWRAAAVACARAALPWDEARASYHLALSLAHARGGRSEIAAALRQARTRAGPFSGAA